MKRPEEEFQNLVLSLPLWVLRIKLSFPALLRSSFTCWDELLIWGPGFAELRPKEKEGNSLRNVLGVPVGHSKDEVMREEMWAEHRERKCWGNRTFAARLGTSVYIGWGGPWECWYSRGTCLGGKDCTGGHQMGLETRGERRWQGSTQGTIQAVRSEAIRFWGHLLIFFSKFVVAVVFNVIVFSAWGSQKEGFGSPGTGAKESCRPPCECWDLNLGLLEEQPVISTVEPSLWTFQKFY